MSLAVKIYHRLPASSRSLVASARGYYLDWWRYNDRTEVLVEEALERDYWSLEQWANWRAERLENLLSYAASSVPQYRKFWSEDNSQANRLDLKSWPILEKATLREHGTEFLADGNRKKLMFHEHTSGTTGTPLDLWITRESVREWYALVEARHRRWYGLTRKDRWAILGGQLVVPVGRQKPPFWVWNSGMNQLYMSSYHISAGSAESYLQALAKYRVKYILGYPSAIYSLAQELKNKKVDGLQVQTVVVNAEPLYDHQRETIAAAFNCPVRETYGMAEIAAAGSECEKGSLHAWPDAGVIEAEANAEGESADLICTGLINREMPLIRYRVGDRGRLSQNGCECGRTLPVIESIDGRIDDVLYTRTGRRIGRLDPVFKGGLPIREAQIVQKTPQKLSVNFVPAEGFNDRSLKSLGDRMREYVGDMEIDFVEMGEIPRTRNGKFRAVVCELSREEIVALSVEAAE